MAEGGDVDGEGKGEEEEEGLDCVDREEDDAGAVFVGDASAVGSAK